MSLNDSYEMKGIPKIDIIKEIIHKNIYRFVESKCTDNTRVMASIIFQKEKVSLIEEELLVNYLSELSI